MEVAKVLHTSVHTLPFGQSYDCYTRVLGMKLVPRPDIPSVLEAWLRV